jgi:hypothetical protein
MKSLAMGHIFGSVALALLMGLPRVGVAQTPDAAAKADILCANAPKGTVQAVPPLLSDWVTVICTPTGQELVPEIKKKPLLWVNTRTKQPFALLAFPPSFSQQHPAFPKDDLRFTRLTAYEQTGDAFGKTLQLWDGAFAPTQRPKIQRTVELDVISVYEGTGTRMFFYFVDDVPRWIVACQPRNPDSCATVRTIDLNPGTK